MTSCCSRFKTMDEELANTKKVLIQWLRLSVEDSSCEDLTDLLRSYPELHFEGKVFVEHRRNDLIQEMTLNRNLKTLRLD